VRRSAAAWALTDQGLSGLSNILLLVFVARSSDSAGFGAFAVLYGVYITALALQRAAVGQATLIRPKAAGDDSSAARMALVAGSLVAVVVIAVAVWLPVSLTLTVLFAVSLPLLLLQDILRYVRLRDGQSQVAAFSDGVWCLVAITLFGIATWTHHASATTITGAWVLGGICSCACLSFPADATSVRGGTAIRAWVADRRTLAGGLGLDALLPAVTVNASILTLAAISGPSAVAQLRACDALAAPLGSFATATGLVMLAHLSRGGAHGRLIARWSLALGLAAAVYCSVLLLLPDGTGESVLGDNWANARKVLPVMSVGYVALALAIPLAATLKARELVRRILLIRVSSSATEAAGVITGGLIAAGGGAAVGIGISQSLTFFLFLFSTRSALHVRPVAAEPL
jgi:O-antigen/teichoic acid export membrane protein